MAKSLKKPIPQTPKEISQQLTGDPLIVGSKPVESDPNKVRGIQTSMKNTNWKDLSVGIEDIDNSIKYYFEQIIKPSVVQNSKRIDVPIIYGSPERWKSVQADGYYRDNAGKIMAPLIMYKHDNIEKNRTLGNKLDGNESHLFQVFEAKYQKGNEYDSFSVLANRQPSKQLYISIVPDYVTVTYSCVLWTEFIEQMNKIVEAINFASDSYWGDAKKFQFRARIDSFSTAVELINGEDRAVKTTFNIVLNGYIIADSINEKLATQQLIYSPAQIVVGMETVGGLEIFNAVGGSTTINPPNYSFVGTGTISGGGSSSQVDVSEEINYLGINNTFIANTVTAPNQATFLNRSMSSRPQNSSLPSPTISNGGFTFFINGQYIPPQAIASFVPSGANLILTFNTAQLGYTVVSTDEITVSGKIE